MYKLIKQTERQPNQTKPNQEEIEEKKHITVSLFDFFRLFSFLLLVNSKDFFLLVFYWRYNKWAGVTRMIIDVLLCIVAMSANNYFALS